MKKFLLLCLLGFLGLINTVRAQVSITYAADSTGGFCIDSTFTIGFFFEAETSGYSNSDTPIIYIDFGDGTDTTFTDDSFFWNYPFSWFNLVHNYSNNGIFDVTYVITMPDMQSDTLFHASEVSLGTCDIVSGNVYVDNNTNCIFDGGDVPLEYQTLVAHDNLTGADLNYCFTDVNGYYQMYVLPSSDVKITLDSYGGLNDFVCPVSGEINIISPSYGNDFALYPQVGIVDAADSSNFYCFTTSAIAGFGVTAETVGYSPSDIPVVYIDFGDGTNATLPCTDFALYYPWVFVNTYHTYTSPGIYDVTYIITMPDLAADTLIVYNDVTVQSCEIISGNVYHDLNTNCVLDGLDVPLYLSVIAQDSGTSNFLGSATTDANGYYELLVPPGLTINLSLSTYFSSSIYVCPISGIITTTAPSFGNDFALNSIGFDIEPYSYGGFFHPGFTETIAFGVWDNDVLNTPDVQMRIVVNDPQITFVSGSAAGGDIIPDVSGDTLTWDIPASFVNNTLNYSTSPLLSLSFSTDISATLGSVICLDVIAAPLTGDNNPLNNIQTMCFPVANSYDPNYIEVVPHGLTSAGFIESNQDMLYTIHFQNTGNFPAVNIAIKDTLDGIVLDLNSFEYLASSHTLSTIITDGNGAMAFKFDNINLPDSTSDEPNSHGWITYRIKQEPNLVPLTTIENTAYIYFDFNAPIITNTTFNTISNSLIVTENNATNKGLEIYPSPASDNIFVVTHSTEYMSYQILDINGNVVQKGYVANGDQLSVLGLSNGLYFLKLENGAVEKVVVQK